MEGFQDFLPFMAEKLGERDFIAELCNGFCLLADPRSGLITAESLRRNSAILGVDSLTDSEIEAMVKEGDLDGDGALNDREFCILMIRLSPSFTEEAQKWFKNALRYDLQGTLKHCKR
uniref:EF-hand domain-containing protein n=1 Tax=Araucaria cunninghamii TaxID=56994 RepID=A0A0D6QSE0_ARACU